jgi:hypothetical protein
MESLFSLLSLKGYIKKALACYNYKILVYNVLQ